MNPSLETYILTVLKMPAKAELVTRLNNLSSLSGTPMSPLLTKWVQQNFGLASVAAIQNWSAGKFSPDMLLRWNSVFPSEFQGGAIRADLYEILTGSGVIPPVADFSGTPTSIYIGDTVAFTDLSTNAPTSWSWAFAGGTPATSTTQNPSVVYNTAGTYNVDLTATNAGGSDLESKPNYITVTNPYLLDNYSGAGAAYSVRKLSNSATSALRVRRSSDNTEQDIGFVGLDLDTTALSSFVGAGNGFVTKWYDQTGNNRHMIQNTAANQPSILNAGVINIRNGKVAIFFNNNNQHILSSTYFLNQQSSFVVSNMNGTTSTFSQIGLIQSQYFELGGYYSQSWGMVNTPGYGSICTTSPSVVDYGTGVLSVTNNTSYLTYLNWNGNNTPRIFRKNAVALPNSANTGSNIRTGTISRGYFNGYLSEIIIYPSDQASNVSGIETNINGYFNIYP